MHTTRRRHAFTLIELVVVVVIIGILAAIAVVGFGSLIDKTRQERVNAAARSFDREYRALLAYETGVVGWDDVSNDNYVDLSDIADDVVAGSSGATTLAVVDAGEDTVTFTQDGRTACIQLSNDPAVPSAFCGATTPGTTPETGSTALSMTIDTTKSWGTTFTVPLNGTVNATIDWGDSGASGCPTTVTAGLPVCTYASEGTYTITVNGTVTRFGVDNWLGSSWQQDQYKMISLNSWGTTGLTSLRGAFVYMWYLNSVPATLPPTVTSLQDTFAQTANQWDASFNGDLSGWDTSNVTNMAGTFGVSGFDNNSISNWNTSNVTTMESMFSSSMFNQPIGGWDTSNVTNMQWMFTGSGAFNQPIGSWDVSSVTNMQEMFMLAQAFNQPIGSWDTSNVTNMMGMFRASVVFNQDLTGWCVSSFAYRPDYFSWQSVLDEANHPAWGTCPD
jgi:prepilin-type N-terminal cleavage/methylation domain-containing protein